MRDCVLLYLNPGRSVIGIHQSLVEASQSDQISWSYSTVLHILNGCPVALNHLETWPAGRLSIILFQTKLWASSSHAYMMDCPSVQAFSGLYSPCDIYRCHRFPGLVEHCINGEPGIFSGKDMKFNQTLVIYVVWSPYYNSELSAIYRFHCQTEGALTR